MYVEYKTNEINDQYPQHNTVYSYKHKLINKQAFWSFCIFTLSSDITFQWNF